MPDAPGYYALGPEALVVSLAVRGDGDAFTELVRRRQRWLRDLLRRSSEDAGSADDMAQHVFLRAWRRIRRLEHPDRFGAWLEQIAVAETTESQSSRTARSSGADDELDDEATRLADEAFVQMVAAAIESRRRRILFGRLAAVAALVALELLLESPVQQYLGATADVLGTSLIPIEDEWLDFALAPINSIAGLFGGMLLGLSYLYRKILY